MTIYRKKTGVGDTYETLNLDEQDEDAGAFRFDSTNPTHGEVEIRTQNDGTGSNDLDLRIQSRHVARGNTQDWYTETDRQNLSPGDEPKPVKVEYQRETEYRVQVRASTSGNTVDASATAVPIPGKAI